MRRTPAAVLLAAAAVLAGCRSPEATRTRGSGPGADVGNRPAIARMHEGANPYWKTPQRFEGRQAPLEPARQADRLSR